jgi:hypothetical protein
MQSVDVDALLGVLQTAIGPVILISGAGLLLLTMTNRLGRVVDRSRSLARRLQDPSDGDNMATRAQLKILVQRTRLLRRAIALASYSVLLGHPGDRAIRHRVLPRRGRVDRHRPVHCVHGLSDRLSCRVHPGRQHVAHGTQVGGRRRVEAVGNCSVRPVSLWAPLGGLEQHRPQSVEALKMMP